MSVDVVYILGPGAEKLASSMADFAGTGWSIVPFETVPAALPSEPPAAILLMDKALDTHPFVQAVAAIEPVCRRPGIILVAETDLTHLHAFSTIIEKSWIRHSLAQFEELGGATFMGEMLELFRDQSEQLLNEFDKSLGVSDAATARRIVHTLKSTLANYGGRRMRVIAQTLENEAALGNLEVVRERALSFASGVRQFREILLATADEISSLLPVH